MELEIKGLKYTHEAAKTCILSNEIMFCIVHMNNEKKGNKIVQNAANRVIDEYWQVDGILSLKWIQRINAMPLKDLLRLKSLINTLKITSWKLALNRRLLDDVMEKYIGGNNEQ